MTQFINKITEKSTPGEKKVFDILSTIFGVDPSVYCYYQPLLGKLYPDFVILAPSFGVVVIEVKDYSPKTLREVDATGKWKRISEGGEEKILSNPFSQISTYWTSFKHLLTLTVKIHRLVIFTYIHSADKIGFMISEVKPQTIGVFFKDHLTNYHKFEHRLWSLVPRDLHLSSEEMHFLRGALIPTSHLPQIKQQSLYSYLPSKEVLKLLDLDQERFSYNLGKGHRLIFGVAGSGKTVLLVARARYLAKKYPKWKILILCYNKLLAKHIERLLNPGEYNADIEISNYHKWAKNLIFGRGEDFQLEYNQILAEYVHQKGGLDEFFTEKVPTLLNRVIRSGNVSYYDAILMDEVQDFTKEWITPVTELLNPETESLLIACDGLQGIYARKRFYWKDVGIQARGRVTKFHKTYRNPTDIGSLAFNFLMTDPEFEQLIDTQDEFLAPEEFARKGGIVDIRAFRSRREEYSYVMDMIQYFSEKEEAILLLFPYNIKRRGKDQHPLLKMMQEEGRQFYNLKNVGLGKKGVYYGTLYATKGLEADVVILVEIDRLKTHMKSRQLLYVGMTRALQALVVTSGDQNEFMNELQNLSKRERYNQKQIKEGKTGTKCFFCNSDKESDNEKPLCIICWDRVGRQEICIYCGARIGLTLKRRSSSSALMCHSCKYDEYSYCKLCGAPKYSSSGKPLCSDCYQALSTVRSHALDY